jgi:YVTN family beta-propeller protein
MQKNYLSCVLWALSTSSIYAQTVAYVTNHLSNNVSVIDVSTNTVSATIPVGKQPSGIAFSPDGSRVYVMNTGENTISIINTATNTVTTSIALDGRPRVGPELIAITPDGKRLYVTLERGSVLAIDTATNAVVATIPVPTPAAVAITPDGSRAYVQTVLTAGVFVIDIPSNRVIAHIAVPSNFSAGISAAPDGGRVYVSGGVKHPDVFVIDTKSNTVVATVPYPGGPQGIVFSPDGRKAYVANELTNAIGIIDIGTNTVESGAIAAGNDPTLVALTPDGKSLYVTNFQWGNVTAEPATVSVIDTSEKKLKATVPVGSVPDGIVLASLNSPFAAFTADVLDIGKSKVNLRGSFTLGANSPGLDLARQPLTFSLGEFSQLIPAGTFKNLGGKREFVFHGTAGASKVTLNLKARRGSGTVFNYSVQVKDKSVRTPNPVNVVLKIGPNTGATIACRNHCDPVVVTANADTK